MLSRYIPSRQWRQVQNWIFIIIIIIIIIII